VGARPIVANLRRKVVRTFKYRYRNVVVVPDNLVDDTDPEQGLALAAHVAEHLVELNRSLEHP